MKIPDYEFKALGVFYILIMICYLSLAYKNKDSDPTLCKGYITFAVGYIFFSGSYLLFARDLFVPTTAQGRRRDIDK